MNRSVMFGLLTSLVLMVGCAGLQSGQSVVKYEAGNPPRVTDAPYDGTFALYSGADLVNPQVTYALKRGDQLGFVMDNNDAVYAVAGDHRDRVVTSGLVKRFYWRHIKAS